MIGAEAVYRIRIVANVSLVVGVVVSTLLPWLLSGEVERNSYEVLRSAEHLGLLDDHGVASVVATIWFFIPLLGALVLLAIATDRRTWGIPIAGLLHGFTAIAAGLTLSAPLPALRGPTIALMLAMLGLLATAESIWAIRSERLT